MLLIFPHAGLISLMLVEGCHRDPLDPCLS